MFCPHCACEFREGFTRCSDCDVDLVSALPVAGEAPHSVLVRIFEASDVGVIAAVKSSLEDAGIELVTRNEGLQDLIGGGRLAGFNPVLGPVEFWVREEDESAARELVTQTEELGEELGEELAESPQVPSAEPLDPDETPQARLPMRYSRPFRRAIAAGMLNVILIPLSAFTAYTILLATSWGQRHSSGVAPTAQIIAGVLFVVMCVVWMSRPKIAAWLQLTLALPVAWVFVAQALPRWKEASLPDGLEEHGLLVIATVLAFVGAVLVVLALLPRAMSRGTN